MRYLIAVLALAGLVVSSFALREHYRTTPAPCDINSRWDCGAVNHSPFAEIGGIVQQLRGQEMSPHPSGVAAIPVAVFGIAGYLAIGALALARRWRLVLALATVAVAFSGYLTYIEAHLLETYCIWCVSSACIISLTEVAAVAAAVRNRRQSGAAEA